MKKNEEAKGTKCGKCKYFYDLDFSLEGYHNCCSEYNCYLCNGYGKNCDDFEEGEVPQGKERGGWKE